MSQWVCSVTLLLCFSTIPARSTGAETPFNPMPQALQTPLRPGGPVAALERLREGSGGKTPVVKEFELDWVRSLADHGKPTIYTRQSSKSFEFIGMPIGGIGCGQVYLGGDGRLWWWDVFNTCAASGATGEGAYANPVGRSAGGPCIHLAQGFAVRTTIGGKNQVLRLDRDGSAEIEFRGQYPIGYVTYTNANLPVEIELEAFSPFVPLDLENSSYPATVLSFTVTNTGEQVVEGELAGWLENAVCLESRRSTAGRLRNRVVSTNGMTILESTAAGPPSAPDADPQQLREEVLFEDFESGTYDGWTLEGEAFGNAPDPNFHHQPLANYEGKRLADSFHNQGRAGADARESDGPTGKLTSKPFRIERRTIKFLIGGGNHPGKTCLNLLVDGKIIRTSTGRDSETLAWAGFDVRALEGKTARIEIVDDHSGGWGHIMVDQIAFTDESVAAVDAPLDRRRDFGSMALALLGDDANVEGRAAVPAGELPEALFNTPAVPAAEEAFGGDRLVGALGQKFKLAPGEKTAVTYVLNWYFPNLRVREFGDRIVGRRYGERFDSARQVAEQVGGNLDELAARTRLWHETWYDSTLPYWFLDRTFLNTSILASSTSFLFRDGRFYGHEGYYQGPGTCTHVWGYVQAPGRLFPEIERRLREMVDYNPLIAFDPQTGRVGYRSEFSRSDAVDGQAGVILRTYLVHQMSPDDGFLHRNYESIKKAVNYLTNTYDADRDGVLTGGQHNTLDARWYGKITWLSLHYNAALRAAGQMAEEMDDAEYAHQVRALADRGRKYIEEKLFNGEYFIHEPDPEHPNSPGVFDGCEYSQLLGQSWAYQVGLGQILDPKKVTTALNSLWKYNFSTDVGPYRDVFRGGRWYAMPGEGGLIACTWPRGGSEAMTHGNVRFAGYLNECQNGYEYAATSLMMWHGLVDKALAHTKVMHQRYHASKRNPWNEVEWGSHYSRSMASYGLFTGICGFEHHGPRGYVAFSPRLTPEDFRAAFTTATGWGTFTQARDRDTQTETLELKWGRLRLLPRIRRTGATFGNQGRREHPYDPSPGRRLKGVGGVEVRACKMK